MPMYLILIKSTAEDAERTEKYKRLRIVGRFDNGFN